MTGGLNAEVSSNQSGSVTTYSVSGYNATTQAGVITDALSNETSNGVTVTSQYNATTQTTAYGVAVATGDGLTIKGDQVEVNTGNGITIGDGGVEINTGNNIFINNPVPSVPPTQL